MNTEDAILNGSMPPEAETPFAWEEGDTADEETSDFLGQLEFKAIPTELSVFHAGRWYVFKLTHSYLEGKEDEQD